MRYIKLYENFTSQKKTFKEWLNARFLTYSFDPEGTIKDIKVLDCSVNNLIDLDGIEDFIYLEKLYCPYNRLTDLNKIKDLLKLKHLTCQCNELTSLEFGDFSIDALELRIDVTDMNRFKELRFLNCKNNKFSDRYEKYITNYCRKKEMTLII